MKKFRVIVLVSIVFAILLALSAYGQSTNFNTALKPFWDLVKYLFVTLPASAQFKYAYFKFVLFLVLGALLLILVRNAPFLKDADETAKKRWDLLAWFIALAAVISIPQKALEFLFKEFGMWGTIALGVALPVLTFINFANQDQKARGWGMIIGGILIAFLGGMFAGDVQGSSWLVIAGIISIIAGIIILVGAGNGWFPTPSAGGHGDGGHGAAGHDEKGHEKGDTSHSKTGEEKPAPHTPDSPAESKNEDEIPIDPKYMEILRQLGPEDRKQLISLLMQAALK